MTSELDPTLIQEIDDIQLPRLFEVLYVEGCDTRDQPFRVSFPKGLEEDTVAHVYMDPNTKEITELARWPERYEE